MHDDTIQTIFLKQHFTSEFCCSRNKLTDISHSVSSDTQFCLMLAKTCSIAVGTLL